jgi:hypothetical protein
VGDNLAERGTALAKLRKGRIEQGNPRCGIGLVFEAAIIVGVPIFESDRSRLTTLLVEQEDELRLLPKAIHKPRIKVKDEF